MKAVYSFGLEIEISLDDILAAKDISWNSDSNFHSTKSELWHG